MIDRLRLPATDYDRIRQQVLRRDGWRCQGCGCGENLQVYHQLSRGRGGADIADNLINLYAD
jgi:5-methylcytosine-specific restriction endonuclease McrA